MILSAVVFLIFGDSGAPAQKKVEPPPAATEAGARRNENVQFNLVDNNSQKEQNVRLGTTATAVETFEAKSNYFGAEFGNPPDGGVHLAQRRLGSQAHGMLSFSHLNSALSARTFFQVGGVQPAHENRFAALGSFGLGSKTFLTVDTGKNQVRGIVNGNVLVPLPSERVARAADPAARQLIERWIAAYPTELPNRTDINARALNVNSPQRIDGTRVSARLDRQIATRDRLFLQHTWSNQYIEAFQFVAGQNPDTTTRSQNSRATWVHGLWTATAGFDRSRAILLPEPNAVGPQVQIGTSLTPLGPGEHIPLDRIQNKFRGAWAAAGQSGRHRWSAGAEFARYQLNGFETSSNRGNYYFRNDFGRSAIDNFLLGAPSRFSSAVGGLDRGFRQPQGSLFAGDLVRVNGWLTVDFGMRYDPSPGYTEVNGLSDVPMRCDCNNLAPRFGFAARMPGGRGVLRGAYGIHYGGVFPATVTQVRWNAPTFFKFEVQGPRDFLRPAADVDFSPGARSVRYVVPRDLVSPYSQQYNLAWMTEPARGWKLDVGYVGSRTWKLFYQTANNRALDIPGLVSSTQNITERRPDARYYERRDVTNMSRAYYDAGRVSVKAPSWRGLMIDASYWLSKAIDLGGAYTNTAAADDAKNGKSQTQDAVTADLKGASAFDQSHAAMVIWRYGAPRRLGGWNLSAVMMAKSGAPFTVITGSDGAGAGNVDGATGDRPMLVDPAVLGRHVNHPDTSRALLPRAAFAYLRPGDARGNLGVSTFRRGGIRNVNAAVDRVWRIHGERTVQFRVESNNLGNTPQFADPNPDLSNPAFGMITNTLNEGRTFQVMVQLRL